MAPDPLQSQNNKQCQSKFCDHDPKSENVQSIPKRLLKLSDNYKITLKDLIDLGRSYHCKLQKTFLTISLERLSILSEPLDKINNIIGMRKIKEKIVEQVIYFLLDSKPK